MISDGIRARRRMVSNLVSSKTARSCCGNRFPSRSSFRHPTLGYLDALVMFPRCSACTRAPIRTGMSSFRSRATSSTNSVKTACFEYSFLYNGQQASANGVRTGKKRVWRFGNHGYSNPFILGSQPSRGNLWEEKHAAADGEGVHRVCLVALSFPRPQGRRRWH